MPAAAAQSFATPPHPATADTNTNVLTLAALTLAVLLLASCVPKAPAGDAELARFLKAKETQARVLAQQSNLKMPAQAWSLFDYLQSDNWSKATNAFAGLQVRSGRSGAPVPPSPLQTIVDTVNQAGQKIGLSPPRASALQDAPWHAIVDAHWAYVLSKTWRSEALELITGGIQKTVPPGAIFFGDSDPGRFAMARAMESKDPGKRFCVITQNQLTDYTYWDYARSLSSSYVTMPSIDDFNSACTRYYTGAFGTGSVAIAALNAEFSLRILRANPSRHIYMEASWFVPEWAYERAQPRGLVFELGQQPISRLDQAILDADREFWSGLCKKLLGDAIRRESSIGEVCEFVEGIYVRNDLSTFAGDRKYASDALAQNWFGMARHGSAALYQRRCIRAEGIEEKERMLDESIFAYKQTFALSPLISKDFADMLLQIGRTNEAARILSVRGKVAGRP